MNEHSMGGPIGQWRGLDPNWNDTMFQTVLVEAPCEMLASTLATVRGWAQQPIDATTTALESACSDDVAFALQLSGHGWSQAYSYYLPIGEDEARELSDRLGARVLFYGWYHEGTVYSIYERGVLQESLQVGGEPAIYGEPNGERDLQRRRAEGWQISLEQPMAEFFTLQGRSLNLRSADELDAAFDRVFRELGIFVANYPWWHQEGTRQVELQVPWRPEHFADVRAVYDAGLPPEADENEDENLTAEEIAEFELFRKVLESDGDIHDILTSLGVNPDDLSDDEPRPSSSP